jgi:hypothetical protein
LAIDSDPNALKPVARYEPLTQETVTMIAGAIGPAAAMVCDLGNADIRRGTGVIDNKTKCIWTKDGYRITFEGIVGEGIVGGGVITSKSKFPDANAPDPN